MTDIYTEILQSPEIMSETPVIDFSTLAERYANFMIDGMDNKTMEQFVFDCPYDSFTETHETVEDLIDEIREDYDDEVVAMLVNE